MADDRSSLSLQMTLYVLRLQGGRAAGGSVRAPPGVRRRLRDPAPQARQVQPESGGTCLRRRSVPGCSQRACASPGWGCENLATVPARRQVLAPPGPRGRPAPWRRPRPLLSGPRPGPRPSAEAPLAGSAPRACPQAPAGSAPPPGDSRPPGVPGPARRVPWATVSRETGPRPRHRHPVRSPPVCAPCGVSVPPPRSTPRPSRRGALSAWGGQGSRGVGAGEAGAFPGPTGLHRGGQGRGPRSGVGGFTRSSSLSPIASLSCPREGRNRGVPLSPLMG